MLQHFAKWLEATPLSLLLQNELWVIPTVQTIHILAIAVVISSVGMIVLRLLGKADPASPVSDTAQRFVPWIWVALVVLAITGSIMVIAEPVRSLPNPAFQLKMLMLVLAMGMTLLFQGTVGRVGQGGSTIAISPTTRLVALATLGLWLGIIIAGRWIAYMILPEY